MASCGAVNMLARKMMYALWEIHTESYPFAGASRHSVGNEHTADLDVSSLEETAVWDALINKLKANMNLTNPYLEPSPQVSMSLQIGLVSVKQLCQDPRYVTGTNEWGARVKIASMSMSRKVQIWERRWAKSSMWSWDLTPNHGTTCQCSVVSR